MPSHPITPFSETAVEPMPADPRPGAGPGWYESSWELRRGLEVAEVAGDAGVLQEAWVELAVSDHPCRS
jgi:hypothetical protein